MKTLPLIPIVAAACLVSYAQAEASTANPQEQLVTACQAGDVSGIKAALKAGAAIDGTPDDDYSPLMYACLNGHLEAVKLLLNSGADINLRLKVTHDALGAAIFSKHPDIAHYLIEQGAIADDLRDSSPEGKAKLLPYLIYSAQAGLVEFVEFFLDAGVAVEDTSRALVIASELGYADIVRLLIERGIDVNQTIENDSLNALCMACMRGNTDCVQLLLDAGADMNARYAFLLHASPLHLAIQKCHADCAMLLLDFAKEHHIPLDLDIFDQTGMNALLRACLVNEFELAHTIIKAGAKVDVCDTDGNTVLTVSSGACDSVAHQVCVEILRAGVSINAVNKQGESALIIASQYGNAFLVDLLVSLGADKSLKDARGFTALDYAKQLKRAEIARLLSKPTPSKPRAKAQAALLQQAEAKLQSTPKTQAQLALQTQLMDAIKQGDQALLARAIDAGADVNATCYQVVAYSNTMTVNIKGDDSKGSSDKPESKDLEWSKRLYSPLSYAAALNQGDVAQYLLQHGADANQLIGYRDSALSTACLYGQEQMVQLLVEEGKLKSLAAVHDTDVLVGLMLMGKREYREQLLKSGWQWNPKDVLGFAIISLVRVGCLDELKECVKLGVKLKGGIYESFLILLSIQEKHLDVLKFLLEEGLNPNANSMGGSSVLARACELQDELAIKLLIQHGAISLGSVAEYQRILPTLSALKADDSVLQLARSEEAFPPSKHPERVTTLLVAAIAMKNLDAVRQCITAGVDFNAKGIDGVPPLWYAVNAQHAEIFKALVDAGIDLETRYEGKTILLLAAESGNLPLVEFLVEQGADIKATDKYGDDARLYALGAGHRNIVDYLDKAAAKLPKK